MGMQWFNPVKVNMPYTSQGVDTFAAAGPYYISSRDPGRSTVLKRNPFYKGSRPANPDQIVFTPNVNVDQSLLQVRAGQSDLDIGGLPPTSTASLGQQYGVNKSRFFVGPTSCVSYMSMNNDRAPFDNVNVRKAVEYAIDRPAQVRLLGAYALEYLMIGFATAVFGVIAGSVAAWLIVTRLMTLSFAWQVGSATVVVVAALVVTVGLGLAGTLLALNQKPASVLRNL